MPLWGSHVSSLGAQVSPTVEEPSFRVQEPPGALSERAPYSASTKQGLSLRPSVQEV